jgi:hypothetical protein
MNNRQTTTPLASRYIQTETFKLQETTTPSPLCRNTNNNTSPPPTDTNNTKTQPTNQQTHWKAASTVGAVRAPLTP